MTRDIPEERALRSRFSAPAGRSAPWVRDAGAALTHLSAELGSAIERDQLIVYGQPVMDLGSGRVIAVEGLVRWVHPERGLMAPGEFLHVAEATDLAIPFGRRVLRESCRMAASWVDLLGSDAPAVHVNISGPQLGSRDFCEEVVQALAVFRLDPSRLVLELSEIHMPLIVDSLRNDLQDLRDRGVKVAIDDAGTRYRTLAGISELPVDILKIDRNLVAGMEDDPAADAVVRNVRAIGDALGLEVVAQGVETSSQALLLADYGCTRVQGYFYSRPLPEQAVLSHLAERHSRANSTGRPRTRVVGEGHAPDVPELAVKSESNAAAVHAESVPQPIPAGGDVESMREWVAALEERERALRAAEELALQGNWMWEVGSGRVVWSDQVHHIFGTDPAGPSVTYDEYLAMIHDDDRETVLSAIRETSSTGGRYEVEHRIVRRDGELREVRSRGRADMGADGQTIRLTGGVQDVTELRAATRELRRSRDLFAGVLDAATEQSIIATDPGGLITVFNTGAERMLGYSAAEMIGTSPERLHDPDEMRLRAAELGMEPGFGVFLARPATGEPETRQWTYVTRDGRRLLASITVSAMRGPEGELTGFIKVGTDITERVRAQAALQESESRFRDLFQYAPTGMMVFGVAPENLGRFLQVNPAMCRLTGYSEQQLLTMNLNDLVAPEDAEASQNRLATFGRTPVLGGSVERHWIHADGSDLWVQTSVSSGLAGPLDASVVGQVEDITARKRAEEALRHQALHDGLTGLPNRILLMDRIEHALAGSGRTGKRLGVMYIDLDGFKGVNDTAGHAAGDQALVHVAQQVAAVLRAGDTLARLGGDEFVIVSEDLADADAAVAIADRVLTALRAPFNVSDEEFALSGSIGVALSDPSSTPEQLLSYADQAMYVAKDEGKGRVRLNLPDRPGQLTRSAQATRLMRVSAELSRALERDELIMYGQPVLDLRSGHIVAVETLVRWVHPDRGVVAPVEFLDVAETTDIIHPIGRRILRESCRVAATWVDLLGSAAPPVHVNVSGRQLGAGNLHHEVLQALSDHRLDPAQLVLELTETHMPLIAHSLRRDLQDLRDRGVKVAIDDLGTGYSSLTRITELPVDILKIDMTFVTGMENDVACAAVVRGILAIGDALGLQVMAEGVESATQALVLADYGCTTAQGFLYSRPLPEEELLTHLADAHRAKSLFPPLARPGQ